MDVIRSLEGYVAANLGLLAPVDRAWQPADFLPDLSAADWVEQLTRFRRSTTMLSDDVLAVLVGNMVTEEALPNYAVSLNQIVKDTTGTGDAPWATWLRGWTAEENRHGDLLNAYLRLTGRVDMAAVERTIHHLIGRGFNPLRGGFDPASQGDAYAGLIYASFQERATRISHGNLARLALGQGDAGLARICRRIAGDEARHESFYTGAVGRLMELDPEGGVLAFRELLRGVIAMPGRRMADGRTPDLFERFAAASQRLGAYYGARLRGDHPSPGGGVADRRAIGDGKGGAGAGLRVRPGRAIRAFRRRGGGGGDGPSGGRVRLDQPGG